jgi:hypothetical protein
VLIAEGELCIALIVVLFYRLPIIKTELDIVMLVIIELEDVVGYIIVILSDFTKEFVAIAIIEIVSKSALFIELKLVEQLNLL